jgi:hypothetical protein
MTLPFSFRGFSPYIRMFRANVLAHFKRECNLKVLNISFYAGSKFLNLGNTKVTLLERIKHGSNKLIVSL